MPHPLQGVYAAAVTPMNKDYSPDLPALQALLRFLAGRGCHGVLLSGTTGEGPSFSPAERAQILRAAAEVRADFPEFRILAGTGTPSLTETIELTQSAFELGANGVVTLPPYYFRKAGDDGLFAWFAEVIRRAVPQDRFLLGYHIPQTSGVGLSLDLLERLKNAFPGRFAGLKDSSGDPAHARALGARFGNDLLVLNGNDRLFSMALENQAGGCITALGNLISPDLRAVWEAFRQGRADTAAQSRLDAARAVSDQFQPAAPTLKAVLAERHGFPNWAVRPPLLPLEGERRAQVVAAFGEVL